MVGNPYSKKVWAAAHRLKNATIFPSFPFLDDPPPLTPSCARPTPLLAFCRGEKKELYLSVTRWRFLQSFN